MASVTKRIAVVKQPKGGYLSIKECETIELYDNSVLNEEENIHPSIVGIAVDYLTRFSLGETIDKTFAVSFIGAQSAESFGFIKNAKKISLELASHIKGLDDESIYYTCKLVTFDVWYRSTTTAMKGVKDYSETNPDKNTIDNIRIMVNRSIKFFDKFGPKTYDFFDFADDGYTSTVDTGDGDFLTEDTLWDFKVSKKAPTTKNTLQILMYFIMGKHSKQRKYNSINKIGIYNPRLNTVYRYDMRMFDEAYYKDIEDNVICYR